MCASRDPGIVEGRDGRPLQPRRIVVVIVLRAHVVCGDQVVAAAPVVIASAAVASRARESDSRERVAGFPGRVCKLKLFSPRFSRNRVDGPNCANCRCLHFRAYYLFIIL